MYTHSGQPVKKCAVFSLQAKPFLFVATKIHVRVYHLQQQRLVKKLISSCKYICSLDVHPSVRARTPAAGRAARRRARAGKRGWPRGRRGRAREREARTRHLATHDARQDALPHPP